MKFCFLLFLNVNFLKNSQTKWFKQSHCFLPKLQKGFFFISFSLFSNKIHKKKNTKIFTTALPVLWFLESFKQQGQLQSAHSPVMDLCCLNLKKTTLFPSKLNELPLEVSLAYKFCLTVHMQYFEVSILFFLNPTQFLWQIL